MESFNQLILFESIKLNKYLTEIRVKKVEEVEEECFEFYIKNMNNINNVYKGILSIHQKHFPIYCEDNKDSKNCSSIHMFGDFYLITIYTHTNIEDYERYKFIFNKKLCQLYNLDDFMTFKKDNIVQKFHKEKYKTRIKEILEFLQYIDVGLRS